MRSLIRHDQAYQHKIELQRFALVECEKSGESDRSMTDILNDAKKGTAWMHKLSNRASADVGSILDYSISYFGEGVMVKYVQSLEKCFEILAENPCLEMSMLLYSIFS